MQNAHLLDTLHRTFMCGRILAYPCNPKQDCHHLIYLANKSYHKNFCKTIPQNRN